MAVTRKTKKERRFTKKMQIKLLAVFAFVLVALIIILIRIVYINVKSGNRYAKQVLSQENYDSQMLYSRRGEIQDTNGRLLAYSEKVYNVVLDCYAINQNEELFGTDRMLTALNRNPEASPMELLQSVKQEIDAFAGDAPQFDDITMLCFEYKG